MKVLLCVLMGVISCSQLVPLQNIYDGLVLGTNEDLVIEAFYDLVCPDSRYSFKALKEVIDRIKLTQFKYIIHHFPLQYHKNALFASAAYRYIYDKVSPEAAYDFTELMLDNLEQFTDLATIELSLNQVFTKIADLAMAKLTPKYQIDRVQLLGSMQPKTSYDQATRVGWKYGTSRNIPGTSNFIVNGVFLDGANNYSADDWVAFINAKNPRV